MHEQLKLGNQLCFRLYTVTRLITQAYRPLLEPLGLTYPQYLVMMVLWEQDNQTVGDIGRRLMLDTNTLTPLLQRMEREGLLVRTHGIADGRQTLVSLTKKGIHLEEQAKDIPECMSQNWHGDTLNNDQINSMVTAVDTLIEGLR
ncbi:MAG: MarR family transcriptional regulator [Bacteroidales bacterium]|nr:MarR family transcriptional regulator [Bacteroidales bacterium]